MGTESSLEAAERKLQAAKNRNANRSLMQVVIIAAVMFILLYAFLICANLLGASRAQFFFVAAGIFGMAVMAPVYRAMPKLLNKIPMLAITPVDELERAVQDAQRQKCLVERERIREDFCEHVDNELRDVPVGWHDNVTIPAALETIEALEIVFHVAARKELIVTPIPIDEDNEGNTLLLIVVVKSK